MTRAVRWPGTRSLQLTARLPCISVIRTALGSEEQMRTRTAWSVSTYLRAKGTDLSGYNQEQLDVIADEINNRPRKTLNAYSPLEVYRDLLLNHHTAPDIIQ